MYSSGLSLLCLLGHRSFPTAFRNVRSVSILQTASLGVKQKVLHPVFCVLRWLLGTLSPNPWHLPFWANSMRGETTADVAGCCPEGCSPSLRQASMRPTAGRSSPYHAIGEKRKMPDFGELSRAGGPGTASPAAACGSPPDTQGPDEPAFRLRARYASVMMFFREPKGKCDGTG